MSIADKLITIAENEQKVYKSGQLATLKKSQYMNGKESGAIVSVNDVTPIEHNVGVKLSSDTITDFTGVEVARYGKNLFDSNAFVNLADNSIYYGINENGEIYIKQSDYRDDTTIPACVTLEAGIYTISSTVALTTRIKLFNITDKTVMAFNLNNTFTLTKTTEIGIKSWFEANTVLGRIQIELGTKTPYEPFKKPQIYTANADGTVEGVKSISPSMTLIPNNNAVTVECEYLRDIDLYIDNLITNVALTGGE